MLYWEKGAPVSLIKPIDPSNSHVYFCSGQFDSWYCYLFDIYSFEWKSIIDDDDLTGDNNIKLPS